MTERDWDFILDNLRELQSRMDDILMDCRDPLIGDFEYMKERTENLKHMFCCLMEEKKKEIAIV